MAPPLHRAQLAHRAVNAVQRRQHSLAQRLAGGGDLHPPGAADEQRRAQLGLQCLDLPADGGLGDKQLVGRRAERQTPRHRLKRAQAVQRQRAAAR